MVDISDKKKKTMSDGNMIIICSMVQFFHISEHVPSSYFFFLCTVFLGEETFAKPHEAYNFKNAQSVKSGVADKALILHDTTAVNMPPSDSGKKILCLSIKTLFLLKSCDT